MSDGLDRKASCRIIYNIYSAWKAIVTEGGFQQWQREAVKRQSRSKYRHDRVARKIHTWDQNPGVASGTW